MTSPVNPPLPPSVLQQQIGPDLQGLARMSGAGQQFSGVDFLFQRLTEIASLLKDVADVLAVTKPSMMPILEVMINAGSSLMNEVQGMAPAAQPSPGQEQINAQMAQPPQGAGGPPMV